jgi:hypothetical protein
MCSRGVKRWCLSVVSDALGVVLAAALAVLLLAGLGGGVPVTLGVSGRLQLVGRPQTGLVAVLDALLLEAFAPTTTLPVERGLAHPGVAANLAVSLADVGEAVRGALVHAALLDGGRVVVHVLRWHVRATHVEVRAGGVCRQDHSGAIILRAGSRGGRPVRGVDDSVGVVVLPVDVDAVMVEGFGTRQVRVRQSVRGVIFASAFGLVGGGGLPAVLADQAVLLASHPVGVLVVRVGVGELAGAPGVLAGRATHSTLDGSGLGAKVLGTTVVRGRGDRVITVRSSRRTREVIRAMVERAIPVTLARLLRGVIRRGRHHGRRFGRRWGFAAGPEGSALLVNVLVPALEHVAVLAGFRAVHADAEADLVLAEAASVVDVAMDDVTLDGRAARSTRQVANHVLVGRVIFVEGTGGTGEKHGGHARLEHGKRRGEK